jgi:hypothetical protein
MRSHDFFVHGKTKQKRKDETFGLHSNLIIRVENNEIRYIARQEMIKKDVSKKQMKQRPFFVIDDIYFVHQPIFLRIKSMKKNRIEK